MQSAKPPLCLSAMDHSGVRSAIWGEGLMEKVGGKKKCSWFQLCKNGYLGSMTWEHKQLSVENLCREMWSSLYPCSPVYFGNLPVHPVSSLRDWHLRHSCSCRIKKCQCCASSSDLLVAGSTLHIFIFFRFYHRCEPGLLPLSPVLNPGWAHFLFVCLLLLFLLILT